MEGDRSWTDPSSDQEEAGSGRFTVLVPDATTVADRPVDSDDVTTVTVDVDIW